MSSGVSVFPDKEMNCYQVESFIGTPCALKKQETLGETVIWCRQVWGRAGMCEGSLKTGGRGEGGGAEEH